jgi:single-strand DNA-binding protein
MYALKNKVKLIGHSGNVPDIRTTDSGKKWAHFSLATNESYRNSKGEKITETNWHQLVAWGKVAEIAEKYLRKGSEIVVEGRLVSRNYVDKDGNKKHVTNCRRAVVERKRPGTEPRTAPVMNKIPAGLRSHNLYSSLADDMQQPDTANELFGMQPPFKTPPHIFLQESRRARQLF